MLACNLNRLSPFQCIQGYGTLYIIITTSWVAHETGSGHPPLLGRDLDHLSCHHSPIRIPGFSYLVDGAIQCPKLITIQHKPDRDFWYSTWPPNVQYSQFSSHPRRLALTMIIFHSNAGAPLQTVLQAVRSAASESRRASEHRIQAMQ